MKRAKVTMWSVTLPQYRNDERRSWKPPSLSHDEYIYFLSNATMTHKMKVTDLSGLDSQLMPHASAELEANICIADAVARLAKDTYDTLPQVGKPVEIGR